MKKSIAVIDCAVKDPAIACFNRLQRETKKNLSYHNFPAQGMRSLSLEEGFDALIILGSHSNVGDGSPWHEPLASFTLDQLKKSIPVLGICFGHQLMAHAFGSTLKPNPNQKILEGLRSIEMGEEFFGLNEAFNFFTAHNYQIENLGEDLKIIGTSKDSPFEMIAHKSLPYWSCQSHPEGSDFFLENEISYKLESIERQKGLDSGLRFLKAFISGV